MKSYRVYFRLDSRLPSGIKMTLTFSNPWDATYCTVLAESYEAAKVQVHAIIEHNLTLLSTLGFELCAIVEETTESLGAWVLRQRDLLQKDAFEAVDPQP